MDKETILKMWDIKIQQDDLDKLNIKYPNLKLEYQTQKKLFGFNMFSIKGHKPTKDYLPTQQQE